MTGTRFESKKFKFRAMGHDSGCDLVWTDLSVSYGDKVGLKSVDEISMNLVKIMSEKMTLF